MLAPAEALFAVGLFLVAFWEVLPPLGRFIPGQLFIGLLAAFAVGLGDFSPWQPAALLLGTLAGDVLNFARAKHHPRFLLGGHNRWWIPGQDLDRLEASLRHNLAATFLRGRFSTRDRALLPMSASAIGARWPAFLRAAVPACLAWSATWYAAGAAIALSFQHLPPAAGITLLLGFLFLATGPVERPETAS